jgi:carbon storage regulator
VLVLSRRPGESIVIGNEVTVTILEVRGDQIRVGVDAPREVQVHREEVFRQLEAENADAAGNAASARRLVARMPPNATRPTPRAEG